MSRRLFNKPIERKIVYGQDISPKRQYSETSINSKWVKVIFNASLSCVT